jgi:hypothetical protein
MMETDGFGFRSFVLGISAAANLFCSRSPGFSRFALIAGACPSERDDRRYLRDR